MTGGLLALAEQASRWHVFQSLEECMRFAANVIFLAAVVLRSFCWPATAQESDAAQVAFNNACRTCHTTREGDNRLGPSLYRVIGRKAGSLPGFGYSDAMKKADLAWDRNNLDRFIANPDQVVPGNNMKPFGGVLSEKERANILAFLESVNR